MSRGHSRRAGPARLLIVDDHAAIRAGLVALLEGESALTLLPAAAGAEEALRRARGQWPDIALLDVSLADGDGLRLCLSLKRLPTPPPVLLYTASVDPLLGFKARLVGADGLIGKAARATALVDAIAAVLRGDMTPPTFDRALARERTEQLPPEAVAIVGLRLEGTPIDGTAEVLGLEQDEVLSRISGVLELLDGEVSPNDRRVRHPPRPGAVA